MWRMAAESWNCLIPVVRCCDRDFYLQCRWNHNQSGVEVYTTQPPMLGQFSLWRWLCTIGWAPALNIILRTLPMTTNLITPLPITPCAASKCGAGDCCAANPFCDSLPQCKKGRQFQSEFTARHPSPTASPSTSRRRR